MGWQDYAHAGVFVLRDRITAVGTVPRPMGDNELTLQRRSTPTFHALPVLLLSSRPQSCYLFT
jgi:hypothetical protein